MELTITVHPRVAQKRPEISDADAAAAVRQAIRTRPRATEPRQWAGIGLDLRGRLLEFVAVELAEDRWLVYHAATATAKMQRELGFGERR